MQAKPYRQHRSHDAVANCAADPTAGNSLLPILQQVQRQEGHLSRDALGAVSDALEIPDARTFSVASFYSLLATQARPANIIYVCDGPVCKLAGCKAARAELQRATANQDFQIERSSCLGLCDCAPAVLVNGQAVGPVEPGQADKALRGQPVASPSYERSRDGESRVAMCRLGQYGCDSTGANGTGPAYTSLIKALAEPPAEVLATVSRAGLQGRGGAGFPTGLKWQTARDQPAAKKYIVCNADESEPMSFKDRILMEGDPHLVLEGMALAGYAVGADTGIVYIRGEYETATRRLLAAIASAVEQNWLGERIQGSGFSFHVHLHQGAGAYICGEETALLESLEGRRGEPRVRPPFPTTNGFLQQPTVVNNVETLCKVPAIIKRGADWYRSLGTQHSPGTKIFTLTGHVNRPGAFEVELGITLREIIEEFGGGLPAGSNFKAALTGGAAGTIVNQQALDVPLDYASHNLHGVALGCGSVMVVDQTVRIVDLLGGLLHFFESESCGKCTPCREGTREARLIIERLQGGTGLPQDLQDLRRLSKMLQLTSLCGLGQSVAWPLESAWQNFGEELATTVQS